MRLGRVTKGGGEDGGEGMRVVSRVFGCCRRLGGGLGLVG